MEGGQLQRVTTIVVLLPCNLLASDPRIGIYEGTCEDKRSTQYQGYLNAKVKSEIINNKKEEEVI